METLSHAALLLVGAALVNNILLTRFIGLCPFFGVSGAMETSIGMSGAVLFVMTLATSATWVFWNWLLVPLGVGEFLYIPAFILVIAALVQFVEMYLRKASPSLYRSLGIYLPLITTNCAVLATATEAVKPGFFKMNIAYSFGFGEVADLHDRRSSGLRVRADHIRCAQRTSRGRTCPRRHARYADGVHHSRTALTWLCRPQRSVRIVGTMDLALTAKAIVALSAIGLLAAGMLVAAAKRFSVEVDPRVEAVIGVLPGSNCGACGNPSCFAAAEAIVDGNGRGHGVHGWRAAVANAVADVMGVERCAVRRGRLDQALRGRPRSDSELRLQRDSDVSGGHEGLGRRSRVHVRLSRVRGLRARMSLRCDHDR